jgi:hypothetical protein
MVLFLDVGFNFQKSKTTIYNVIGIDLKMRYFGLKICNYTRKIAGVQIYCLAYFFGNKLINIF